MTRETKCYNNLDEIPPFIQKWKSSSSRNFVTQGPARTSALKGLFLSVGILRGSLLIYEEGWDRGLAWAAPNPNRCLLSLKELSVLKELDSEYEGSLKTESERDAHRLRQQRRHAIAEEIKALAAQRKNDVGKSTIV
jgi:hypothetical protein